MREGKKLEEAERKLSSLEVEATARDLDKVFVNDASGSLNF